MRDSAVMVRLCPFVVGEDADVSEGDSSSVTNEHNDVSERGRADPAG